MRWELWMFSECRTEHVFLFFQRGSIYTSWIQASTAFLPLHCSCPPSLHQHSVCTYVHLLYYSQHVGVNTQGVFQKSGTTACLHSSSALFCICSPSPLLLLSSSHFSQRSSHCLLFNSATSMNKDDDIRKVLKGVPHKWMRSCTINRWRYKLVSGHI